ncbi:NAD(P)H-dependent oxidoreductase [Christensenellaceae bacterium OttesenSCG-928-M15]|nr:NAD(P)H-dependent oxidoreductase [Christensenellaceae bacterium OttesenSCG-928-M15]
MREIRLGVVVGSNRRGSYSKMIAKAVTGFLPANYSVMFLEIGDLPIFNQDYDDDHETPAQWTRFREEVKSADAFLFITPEYNRSMPPLLKNALDVASRPYGQNAWGKKPGAIISVSPGKPGGFGANHHLRQCMSFLNIYMMQQPEAYIGNVTSILDDGGNVTDDGSAGFLKLIAEEFAQWVGNFQK